MWGYSTGGVLLRDPLDIGGQGSAVTTSPVSPLDSPINGASSVVSVPEAGRLSPGARAKGLLQHGLDAGQPVEHLTVGRLHDGLQLS
ncbi:hypothetical protein EFW17_07690 [Halostreptopolyspora alba]|uniref:Uncharacterized protein n=1 Tax=Halostreptopolyspora alba TaxID=2487137 RepID=A0A3N0EDA2_9ACTN|nr:hypothetical protein EFW17_07690 [Nocardiopsaceae bacterium YIM 96095]